MASTKTSNTKTPPLGGPILVVGGCGALGFHLVRRLRQEPDCGPIIVLDRNTGVNNVHQDGATTATTYLEGDIRDAGTVTSVIEKVRPTIVFHVASPRAMYPEHGDRDFWDTNVRGTNTLLQAATDQDSVQAFVFESTIDVYAGSPHDNIDETHPLWDRKSRAASDYHMTKSEAEKVVLAANGPRLRTVALRSAHHYGERDTQGLPAALNVVAPGRKRMQVGDGTNMFEVVSLRNVAEAHVLAARALLYPETASGKVDGEAFNISDDHPVPFWYHFNQIWKSAAAAEGYEFDPNNYMTIPAWAAIAMCIVMEWLFWIFTLGWKKPPAEMRRWSIEYTHQTFTYSSEKAKQRLGFRPVVEHDEVVRAAVEWEVRRRRDKEAEKQRKKVR